MKIDHEAPPWTERWAWGE